MKTEDGLTDYALMTWTDSSLMKLEQDLIISIQRDGNFLKQVRDELNRRYSKQFNEMVNKGSVETKSYEVLKR